MIQKREDSYEESPVVCHKKTLKKLDRPSRFKNSRPREDTSGSQLDQALINERILTQLDAIGKRLTAGEQNLVSIVEP